MKKILLYVLMLFAFNSSCFGNDSGSTNTSKNDSEELTSLGRKYAKNGNNEKAIEAYQKAIALDNKNAKAHAGLGTIYARTRDYAKAMDEYKIGIELGLDSDYEVDILPKILAISMFREKKSDLKKYFIRLAALDHHLAGEMESNLIYSIIYGLRETNEGLGMYDPFRIEIDDAYYDLADKAFALRKEGKIEESIDIYLEFINKIDVPVKMKAQAFNDVGKIYLQYGIIKTGIDYLKKSVELLPGEFFWRQELITILASTQFYSDALNETEKLLQDNPNDVFCYYIQGIIYKEYGTVDEAIEAWGKLKQSDEFVFLFVEDKFNELKKMPDPNKNCGGP